MVQRASPGRAVRKCLQMNSKHRSFGFFPVIQSGIAICWTYLLTNTPKQSERNVYLMLFRKQNSRNPGSLLGNTNMEGNNINPNAFCSSLYYRDQVVRTYATGYITLLTNHHFPQPTSVRNSLHSINQSHRSTNKKLIPSINQP
jgi:hypothetical protein